MCTHYSSQLQQRDNHFIFCLCFLHTLWCCCNLCMYICLFCAGFDNWQEELSLNFETSFPFLMVITINTCMKLQQTVRGFLVFRNGQDLTFCLVSLIIFLNLPLTVREKFNFFDWHKDFLKVSKMVGSAKAILLDKVFKSLYILTIFDRV